MMTKNEFLKVAPKTRAEFVTKYRNDHIFRNTAKVYGITVIGDCVSLPNGKVIGTKVR